MQGSKLKELMAEKYRGNKSNYGFIRTYAENEKVYNRPDWIKWDFNRNLTPGSYQEIRFDDSTKIRRPDQSRRAVSGRNLQKIPVRHRARTGRLGLYQ